MNSNTTLGREVPSFSEKIQQQDYDLWEREFLDHPHAVTAQDIRDDQGAYIFRCDFFELKE
ncbi:MAG: hypothetical protein ACXVI0_10065, partial [Halobacteriota archaeon]